MDLGYSRVSLAPMTLRLINMCPLHLHFQMKVLFLSTRGHHPPIVQHFCFCTYL